MCAFSPMFSGSCVTDDFQRGSLHPENSQRPAALPQSMHCTGTAIWRETSCGPIASSLRAGRTVAIRYFPDFVDPLTLTFAALVLRWIADPPLFVGSQDNERNAPRLKDRKSVV